METGKSKRETIILERLPKENFRPLTVGLEQKTMHRGGVWKVISFKGVSAALKERVRELVNKIRKRHEYKMRMRQNDKSDKDI